MKYQLVNVEQHELLAKGICERVGSAEAFHKHGLDKNEEVIDAKMSDHDDAMALVLESLTAGPAKAIDSLDEIDAVGHRIVQGGKYFDRSVLIDDDVIDKIDELAELAPLHNRRRPHGHPRLPEAHAGRAYGGRVRHVVLPDAAAEGLHVPACPTSCTRSTPSASTAPTARRTATSPSAPPSCSTSRWRT